MKGDVQTPTDRPLSRPRIAAVLVGLVISICGDEVALVALTLKAADSPQGAAAVAALLIAGLLPGIVLGNAIGRRVDASHPKRLIATALLLEAAIAASAARLDALPLLIAAAALLGGLGSLVQVCVMAHLPRAVPDHRLPHMNGLLEGVRNAGYIAGPLLAGALVALGGTSAALLVNAASFLVAVAVVPLLPFKDHRTPSGSAAETGTRLDRQLGLRLLWGDPDLRRVLAPIAISIIATSAGNVVLPFFVRDELQSDAAVFGLLLSLWAAGLVLGPLLLTRPLARADQGMAALASAGVIGSVLLVTGATATLGVAACAYVLGGMANATQNATLRTAVMRRSPEAHRGLLGAAYGASLQTAVVLGFLIGGATASDRAADVLAVGGAVSVVAVAAGFVLMRRPIVHAR